MAVLTRQEKKDIARPWVQRVFADARKTANLSLTDMEPAIQATEDWIQANQSSFLLALPEPFRSNTDGTEKTLLFVYVAMKRAGLI